MSNGTTPATGDPAVATDPGQAGGGSALDGSGAGASGTGSGAAGAEPSGNDFEARVRAGGDFAVSQVKDWQRRADQASQKEKDWNEWAGPLAVYREQGLTGQQIAGQIGAFLEIQNDPKRKAMLDKVIAGDTSVASNDDDDLYLTDDERKVRDLEQKLQSLEQRLGQQHSVQGQDALMRHLGAVASEWHLSDEQVSQLSSDLIQQVQLWGKQGKAGEVAIDQLTSQNGRETVELMMMKRLGRKGLTEQVKQQLLRDQGVRERLSTDGPSLRLSPDANPPENLGKDPLETLRFAQQNPEMLDRLGYRD